MIRKDLCEEAARLAKMLVQHQWGNLPQTNALLALMLFNIARLNGRESQTGLVLLEHQERQKWDQQKIAEALVYLNQSAKGEVISRYHIEASIAAEHCLAKTYRHTRWDKIIKAYELLEKVAASPMHSLNRALAIAEFNSAELGLEVLESIDMPGWLQRSYYWYAVLADLQFRAKQTRIANKNANEAIRLAPALGVKDLLKKRMSTYEEFIQSPSTVKNTAQKDG
jgi:RNA polymerase sigma-70 factor (ECF subfamily)